jgi:hypothetical protein
VTYYSDSHCYGHVGGIDFFVMSGRLEIELLVYVTQIVSDDILRPYRRNTLFSTDTSFFDKASLAFVSNGPQSLRKREPNRRHHLKQSPPPPTTIVVSPGDR